MAYTNENQQLMQKLSGEISKVIKGKGEAVQLILTALLAQGHVLIEDVPGRGQDHPCDGSGEGNWTFIPQGAVYAGRDGFRHHPDSRCSTARKTALSTAQVLL